MYYSVELNTTIPNFFFNEIKFSALDLYQKTPNFFLQTDGLCLLAIFIFRFPNISFR